MASSRSRESQHTHRLEHYLILNKHPEFACAAREKKHLGEPITDPREHACTRVSLSRHRCLQLKLGHDLRAMHTTQYGE
jgi:hypothetical protein